MDKPFDSYRQQFLEVYRKVAHLQKDDILFHPIHEYLPYFEALVTFGQQQPQFDKPLENYTQKVPQVEKTLKKVSELVSYFGLRFEIDTAQRIINSNEPMKALQEFPLYEGYLKMVETEVVGAGLLQSSKLVFLGSGPFPLSLILFYLYYGIEGIGIEREKYAFDTSSKLIAKLGLQDKIKLSLGDHSCFNFNAGFNHIIIALEAEPKSEIFEQIQALSKATTLSYRMSRVVEHLFDAEGAAYLVPPSFVSYLQLPVQPPGVGKIIFLRKQ